jgi:FMN phosphatase YigB (HAD superfamily)
MFEYCFASHIKHKSKPDPQIYQEVDNQLRTWKCELPFYFVDDIAINRQEGEKIGWKTYETIYELNIY